MWEPLFSLVADKYHLIAPDYPGFGNSSAPSTPGFEYTFDNLARVMDELTTKLGITKYVLFMQDYGGPVGFRMALSHRERVRAIIVQNAVSHDQGLSPLWGARRKYWADPVHELENLKANLTFFEATRQRHLGTSPHPDRYNPDTWTDEYAFLTRPGQADIQATLFLDNRNNVASYPLASRGTAADPGRLGKIRPPLSPSRAPLPTPTMYPRQKYTSWKPDILPSMRQPTRSPRTSATSSDVSRNTGCSVESHSGSTRALGQF
jgi:pimeloyl-ACP methyl ester carboxylesterase